MSALHKLDMTSYSKLSIISRNSALNRLLRDFPMHYETFSDVFLLKVSTVTISYKRCFSEADVKLVKRYERVMQLFCYSTCRFVNNLVI